MSAAVSEIYARAVAVVARSRGIKVSRIKRPHSRQIRRLRQVSLYLTVVECGVSSRALAAVAAVERRSIGYSLQRVEDLRDDPGFDAWLNELAEQMYV